MKHLHITTTIIAFIILIVMCSTAYFESNTHKTILGMFDKIDGLKIDYRASELTKYNALLDKVEELTRDNERLIAENAALKDYIKGFEGFWKE